MASNINVGRDSQSQSVPHSVSSTSNSVSSSGQNQNAVNIHSESSLATSHKFRCRFCDKECGSECRLEVHLRSHTGDQPYKCTMAGCGKAFKQKVNLKRHLNKHLNNGEFACSHCDRRFVYKCDLTAHQRIHSGEKPFGCNYCLKRFNQKRDLSRHLNTHSAHRQLSSAQSSPLPDDTWRGVWRKQRFNDNPVCCRFYLLERGGLCGVEPLSIFNAVRHWGESPSNDLYIYRVFSPPPSVHSFLLYLTPFSFSFCCQSRFAFDLILLVEYQRECWFDSLPPSFVLFCNLHLISSRTSSLCWFWYYLNHEMGGGAPRGWVSSLYNVIVIELLSAIPF